MKYPATRYLAEARPEGHESGSYTTRQKCTNCGIENMVWRKRGTRIDTTTDTFECFYCGCDSHTQA